MSPPSALALRWTAPTEFAGLSFGATKQELLERHGCATTPITPDALTCPPDRSVTGAEASVSVELCEGRLCTVTLSHPRPAGLSDGEWVRSFLDLEKRLADRYGAPDPRPHVDMNYCTNLPTLLPVCLAGGEDFDVVEWRWGEGFLMDLRLTREPIMPDAYSVTLESPAGVRLQMEKIAD